VNQLKPRLTTTFLVFVIIAMTIAMGFVFDSGGLGAGGAGDRAAGEQSSSSLTGAPPRLLVKAYEAQRPLSSAQTSGGNMTVLSPIAGLEFTLVATEVGISRLGRPLTYYVFTNSSGMGTISVTAGNYSIEATTAQFNLTRPVGFTGNATTEVELVVLPVLTNITALSLVSPDQSYGLEPGGLMYVEVPGALNYSGQGVFAVLGTPLAGSGEDVTSVSAAFVQYFNATLLGAYPAPGGTMLVLTPTGPYGDVPAGRLELLQYVVDTSVRTFGR
jgi:hypothetical protein